MGFRPQRLGLGKYRERNSRCTSDRSEGYFQLNFTAMAPSLECDDSKGHSRFFCTYAISKQGLRIGFDCARGNPHPLKLTLIFEIH